MKKGLLIFGIIVLLIVMSIYGYVTFKKVSLKNDVEDYLLFTGVNEDDIVMLTPLIANIEGDKNFQVSVRFKDDENIYYYYKDTKEDKVILESSYPYQLESDEYEDPIEE
ncbi:hypothetical protein ACFOZ1_01275 [Gracilibacillus marinus]|uniref:DUF3139 domain-containing protein n=1 Tax=Gracilibacillus marinus TaxID=630535 RepID=A0ABV8VR04_9BACI